MASRPRHLGATKNDADPNKAYPASIASVFASLRQFWASHTGDRDKGYKLSADEFKESPPEKFCEAVDYVADNFRKLRKFDDNGNINYAAFAQRLQKLERGGDDVELGFEDLIVAAEWTGLTVAQFMTFCNLVSIERRAKNAGNDPKKALRQKLNEYQAVLDALNDVVNAAEAKHVFYEESNTEADVKRHKYYAKEEVLLVLAEARRRVSERYE